MKRTLAPYLAGLYLALLGVFLAGPGWAEDAGSAPTISIGAPVAAPVAAPAAIPGTTVDTPSPASPSAGAPIVAPDPGANPAGFAGDVWNAFEHKDWGKLLFFGITVMVFAIRKFLGVKFPVLMTAPAGVAMNFAIAFGGMLANSWPAGTKVTEHAIFTALYGGFIAAGGWTIVKNLWEHFSAKGANPAAPPAPKPTA